MIRSRFMLGVFAVVIFITVSFVAVSPANAEPPSDVYQQVINFNSGMCLTVTGGAGTPVIQAVCATPGSTPLPSNGRITVTIFTAIQ